MANLAKIIPMSQYRDSSSATSQVDQQSKDMEKKSLDVNEKLVKTSEKLSTNLEKLALAVRGGAIKSSGAGEVNYKQGGAFDQRTVKDQFKDGLMGRKGSDGKRDPFDQDSLKYKLGSVRGLGKSVFGMKDDSFFGNLAGRREDKLKRADTLMKMNPQMKNLKQFGGDDEKVRQYYIKQHEEKFAPAQAKTQAEKYKMDSLMASGISEEEFGKSVGGKRQKKAFETAQAEELSVDKFRKQEVKGVLDGMAASVAGPAATQSSSNVIPFPSSGGSGGGFGSDKETTLENNRLMVQQNDLMAGMRENTGAFPIYLEEWREEKERIAKADAELLAAVKAGGSGSSIGDVAGSAMDLLGNKAGKAGKIGGIASKAGSLLQGASKFAGPAAAIASIGAGAYTAYSGFTGANEKLAKGEITAEQATVEKGGAIGEGTGQAVGGTVGALKGAAVGAAIGSVVPVLGTAVGGLIGAAVGGLGGSFLGGKAGSFLGETGGKIVNAFSGPNPDKSGATAKTQTLANAPNTQTAPKEAPAAPTAKQQEEGLKAYDKAYHEARSDGKTVAESKKIAAESRSKALGQGQTTKPTSPTAPAEKTQSMATPSATPKQEEGLKAYDKAYTDARSSGKTVAESKKIASEAAKTAAATPATTTGDFARADRGASVPATDGKTAPSDRAQKAEDARQNALRDGASPQEADAIAAKMMKYGSVISAGQGRGDVYQPATVDTTFKPASAPTSSKAVDSSSKDVAAAKESQGAPQINTASTVNQTNVQQRTTTAIKPPIRNQDSSFYNMVESKYVY
jgi:hypothetical protein